MRNGGQHDHLVAELYQAGVPNAEIAARTGLAVRSVYKAIYRLNLPRRQPRGPKRGEPVTPKVKQLAKEGKDAHFISAAVGKSYRSVSTILTDLRRKGEIGIHDGRVIRSLRHGLEGAMPIPELRLELDYETRTLLDGEAVDLDTSPNDVARRIIRAVLSDQELLEAALAA